MSQMPLFESQFWTVSNLTRYLRDLIEGDPILGDVWVQGEVSNLSRPSSGHLYFTMKDSTSTLRCVMWRNTIARQPFIPHDGQAIEVHGSVGVYEAGGQYQLYVDQVRSAGEGALYQEFLRLKAVLESEGLFDPDRKRPVPTYPQKIGVITSPTGAAIKDILNTLSRRYPLAEVILASTQVQGEEAPKKIVEALERMNEEIQPDVILLARGGGSIEDLWAFNDESVARAIYRSEAPVITGVGHETDFTIADFVSDLRAPTPTAAAELATPNLMDLIVKTNELKTRLENLIDSIIAARRWNLDNFENQLSYKSPITSINSNRQRLDEYTRRCEAILAHRVQMLRAHLEGMRGNLISLNPYSILQRGFAAVTMTDGKVVSSVRSVKPGDELNIQVQDGKFDAEVKTILGK